MRQRVMMVLVAMLGMLSVGRAGAQMVIQEAPNRLDIVDVGDPILISRKTLAGEMTRNAELREWVDLYGVPDYAEVQEIEVEPPFASYEVRLYYLKGNAYLAFGRVHVAPSLYDYGVRKYVGHIKPADLDRLLTARTAEDFQVAAAEPVPLAPWIVETTAVEGKPVGE
ncbi:MAG: hypothetical protein ABI629_11640 [bacterium]